MPYVPQGRLVNDLATYEALTGFKAMAVAKNGVGLGFSRSQYISQEDANKAVLAACQVLAQNEPCSLFAEGNQLKYDESDFYLKHESVIESGPRVLDFAKIPGLISILHQDLATRYATNLSMPYKAIAIGNYGKVPFMLGATQADANRRVLELCEAITAETCTLYAEGNQVVFNVTEFNWNYSIRYLQFAPTAFDASKVPFVGANFRTDPNFFAGIPAMVTQGRNPVVALGKEGHFWIGSAAGKTVAENRATAQTSCDALIPGGKHKCIIYSINNDIVWTRAQLDAEPFW